METTIFEIDESRRLSPLDPDSALQRIKNPDARMWVNLQDPQPDEVESWLDTLAITGLPRRLCLEARDRPGFYPLKNELFLVIPVPIGTDAGQDVDFITCICTEKLLVTLHHKPIFERECVDILQDPEAWLPERSIATLLSALLMDLTQHALRFTTSLRASIHRLEERMDREPGEVEADEIVDIRAELLPLAAAVDDWLPVLKALRATAKPYFQLKDDHYTTCALVNLEAARADLDRFDDRIDALHAGFQMHAQDRMNRRLALLTILSAIFMPITLLAGIWGMNFAYMPELKFRYSYPVALALMVVIGVGLFLFFRRRGWFR